MTLLTEEHRSSVGRESAPIQVEVSRRGIIKYALATEQLQDNYRCGDEAPLMFVFNLFGTLRGVQELRNDGLPRGGGAGSKLPLKRVMAGGTEIVQHRPIRPGDRLTGVQRIHYDEIYTTTVEKHPGIVIDASL